MENNFNTPAQVFEANMKAGEGKVQLPLLKCILLGLMAGAFIAFGGVGGTYDIGLQSLSGAMERGHNMTYICYDNGAYMNTGIQRSSATPKFADTTTSPAGSVIPGKMQARKDLAKIMVGHHLPYVAQTAAFMNFKDLYEKSEKAIYTEGPTFLNVLSPCPRGWGYATEDLMLINKLAIDTCYWPLYEVIDGVYHITYKPAKKLPIEEFLKPQKRFKHMFKPGNEWMIEEFQKENVVVAFSSDDPKDGEEKGQYGRNSDHPAQSDDPPVMPSVIWT